MIDEDLMYFLSVMHRIKLEIEKENDDSLLERFYQSFSPNQISSKLWLVKELRKHLPLGTCNIEIVGGWFGYPLIYLIRKYLTGVINIYSYDIDEKSCKICDRYKTYYDDKLIHIKNMDYWKDFSKRKNIDVIINTSSEHMEETHSLNIHLYNNPIVVIQSNDMKNDEHINLCYSEDELVMKHDFTKILYKGTMKMSTGYLEQYRYMVIGQI